MKHLALKLDTLAFSGSYIHDAGKPNMKVTFDLKKPDETIVLKIGAPVVGNIDLELDFVEYSDGTLRLHILSSKMIVSLLLQLLKVFNVTPGILSIHYPILSIDMQSIISDMMPGARCVNVSIVNHQYFIEIEVS